eukprot:NODE_9073_length_1448_cov_10.333081.p1 GENE.NODE_9073_length_1448_cov_10.333081~~NODE_9073_length_1448_cov_10.333081.p1  ORF type:complete len:406 (-),score=46.05 NODE_9073_length_1448_cov_10.333081:127-1344(-)
MPTNPSEFPSLQKGTKLPALENQHCANNADASALPKLISTVGHSRQQQSENWQAATTSGSGVGITDCRPGPPRRRGQRLGPLDVREAGGQAQDDLMSLREVLNGRVSSTVIARCVLQPCFRGTLVPPPPQHSCDDTGRVGLSSKLGSCASASEELWPIQTLETYLVEHGHAYAWAEELARTRMSKITAADEHAQCKVEAALSVALLRDAKAALKSHKAKLARAEAEGQVVGAGGWAQRRAAQMREQFDVAQPAMVQHCIKAWHVVERDTGQVARMRWDMRRLERVEEILQSRIRQDFQGWSEHDKPVQESPPAATKGQRGTKTTTFESPSGITKDPSQCPTDEMPTPDTPHDVESSCLSSTPAASEAGVMEARLAVLQERADQARELGDVRREWVLKQLLTVAAF